MLSLNGKDILTNNQVGLLCNTLDNIIESLPGRALNQLLSGYDNDVDRMLVEMLYAAEQALNLGKTLDSENLDYVENVKATMDTQLKKLSFNYFKTTMLPKYRMGWRNLEWGNMIQLFPWSSYLCARGSGKCFSKDTLVVMFDGSVKKIQDIEVGDFVMGVDSTPRHVLKLHRGQSQMYKVNQSYSKSYEVNEGHLVCCKKKERVTWKKGNYRREWKYYNIPVEEISKTSGYSQNKIMGYRVKGWELPAKPLPIDPYILGSWLGDGNTDRTVISNIDEVVLDYWKDFASKNNLEFNKINSSKCSWSITVDQKPGKRNWFLDTLRDLNVIGNKHIPDIYMRGSRLQRLELLAGILDSDGHSNANHFQKNNSGNLIAKRSYELTMINENLIGQIQQLAWSLGFRCKSINKRRQDIKLYNDEGKPYILKNYQTFRINISGDVHQIPVKIERKKIDPLKIIQDNQVSSLSIEKTEIKDYYGFACDGDHKFLLADGTVVHNSFEFSYAFPLWRLYSYDSPTFWMPDSIDNANRKETCYITSTMTLAKVQVAKVREEIETNDLIKEKINPNGKASIGETHITSETGSILHVRGRDGFIRGLHVGACVCDDMPDESSLYSNEQRDKLKELIKGTIEPIVEPYGYFIVAGTPFAAAPNELYQVLKADKRFYCFEYPVIFPDGRPLAPDRYTFQQILEKKVELGTIVFNREYLVVPISDSSTIFPYEYLMRSILGMENVRFASSIDDFPIKLVRVNIGVDFAISGNIGADFTVYTVWGVDAMNNFYLLYYYRKKGMSHNEQVDKIVQLDRLFRPNKIVCESNGFQGILASMATERGLVNIETFTTTEGNKKDLHQGWPSLSAMFERGQIKCPYAVGETKDAVTVMFSEFASVTFKSDTGKLEAGSGHDDIVSSSFMAINSLREGEQEVKFQINTI